MDVFGVLRWLALALALVGAVAVVALAGVVALAHVRLWWWRRRWRGVR